MFTRTFAKWLCQTSLLKLNKFVRFKGWYDHWRKYSADFGKARFYKYWYQKIFLSVPKRSFSYMLAMYDPCCYSLCKIFFVFCFWVSMNVKGNKNFYYELLSCKTWNTLRHIPMSKIALFISFWFSEYITSLPFT